MSYQIQGKLQSLSQPEQKTETFTVQTGILEVEENVNGTVYKNYIGFQMTNKSVGILDAVAPGSIVNLHFDLRGNMWRDKAITNVNVYKVETVAPAAPNPWQQPQQPQAPQGNPWQQPQAPQAPQGNPWQPQPQQEPLPQAPQGNPWPPQPQQARSGQPMEQQPQPQPQWEKQPTQINPWQQQADLGKPPF